MRLRYGLYLLGLFMTFLALFEFIRFGDLREDLSRRSSDLIRLRGDILRKAEDLDRLKELVRKYEVPVLEREKALEAVISEVERLKKFFSVTVRRDVVVENNVWRMDVDLSFVPKDRSDLVSKMKAIGGSISPVVHVSRVEIRQRADRTEVKISLRIYQPFVEAGR